MSEQAVQATVSGPMMGKVFTKTATDDQWDGNTLTDSLSGQQIGILMPGATVNQVQFQYTAGLVAWRIQNAATLTFQRFGFGTKDGFACFHSTKIAPYTINPNDIIAPTPLPSTGRQPRPTPSHGS